VWFRLQLAAAADKTLFESATLTENRVCPATKHGTIVEAQPVAAAERKKAEHQIHHNKQFAKTTER
jgi:hypothetical protein